MAASMDPCSAVVRFTVLLLLLLLPASGCENAASGKLPLCSSILKHMWTLKR